MPTYQCGQQTFTDLQIPVGPVIPQDSIMGQVTPRSRGTRIAGLVVAEGSQGMGTSVAPRQGLRHLITWIVVAGNILAEIHRPTPGLTFA